MRARVSTHTLFPSLSKQTGDKWNYGLSTDVLILIASKVTGLSIDGFMQERLFGTCVCLCVYTCVRYVWYVGWCVREKERVGEGECACVCYIRNRLCL